MMMMMMMIIIIIIIIIIIMYIYLRPESTAYWLVSKTTRIKGNSKKHHK